MDYQTFSSPQPPPAFGGAVAGFSSSAPSTQSPQQQQLYGGPQAGLQQSQSNANPPFPYGAAGQYANGHGGQGAALHQARAHQMQPHPHPQALHQQSQPSPSPYSSAPFAQPLASPVHPYPHARPTASPPGASNTARTASPYATPQQHPQALSMNPPATSQSMAHTPVKPVALSPASPVSPAREKQRIDTLLEINQALIQEVMELHTQGKAGHIGPAPEKAEGEKQQQPSLEYRDCMRRLQANLAFLAQNAEKHNKPNANILPGPAIMNPPSSPERLVDLYIQLKTLFPGWTGAQAKTSPGPQRLNSTSSQASMQSHMQPPNSAGLHSNMNMNMNMNMQPPGSAGLPPNMQLPSNANPQMNHMQNHLQSQ